MTKDITVTVLGGTPKTVSSETVKTVADAMKEAGISGNYTASVNGSPAALTDSVKPYDFINFAEAVKGGC